VPSNLALVPYTTAEGRQQLLDTLADAVGQLGAAVAALSELYERLDELSADAVEEQLFRPVQAAYGRAQRAHAGFAERHGLPVRAFEAAALGAPGHGVKGFMDAAVTDVAAADRLLAELQDSMLPVEVGDTQVRADLEQIRTSIGGVGLRARELERTLGR
jgi:hypothetical protein